MPNMFKVAIDKVIQQRRIMFGLFTRPETFVLLFKPVFSPVKKLKCEKFKLDDILISANALEL